MSIFSKKIPATCPKCGKAAGWHPVKEENTYNEVTSARAVNSFSSAPIRNTFGQNLTRTGGSRKKLKYCCNNCGYEKSY